MTKRLAGIDDPRLEWFLVALPEDIGIEGNCSAIDPETDAETEAMIRAQLAAGNEWAWCQVVVSCKFRTDGGTFEGRDTLGACSYASEADFRRDGYYSDMRAEAFADLCNSMQSAIERGELARGVLFRKVS